MWVVLGVGGIMGWTSLVSCPSVGCARLEMCGQTVPGSVAQTTEKDHKVLNQRWNLNLQGI